MSRLVLGNHGRGRVSLLILYRLSVLSNSCGRVGSSSSKSVLHELGMSYLLDSLAHLRIELADRREIISLLRMP